MLCLFFCLKHTTYAAKRVLKIPNAHQKTSLFFFAVRFKAQHSLYAIEPECVILKPIIRIKTRNVFSSLCYYFYIIFFSLSLLLLLFVLVLSLAVLPKYLLLGFFSRTSFSSSFFIFFALLPNKHYIQMTASRTINQTWIMNCML